MDYRLQVDIRDSATASVIAAAVRPETLTEGVDVQVTLDAAGEEALKRWCEHNRDAKSNPAVMNRAAIFLKIGRVAAGPETGP